MKCLYPENTGLTAYRKGCRCSRCYETKAVIDRQRVRVAPCVDCGGPKPPKQPGAKRCENCAWQHLIKRISDRVDVTPSGCWIFTGDRNNSGYGHISFGRGSKLLTHRVMYEHWVGPLGDGLEIDHLCRTKACCNPDHLEQVTHQENALRHHAAKRREAQPVEPVIACRIDESSGYA